MKKREIELKYECKSIQVLLPNYAEGLCCEEERRAVEEHVRGCEECRELLDALFAKEYELEDSPPKKEKPSPKRRRRRFLALLSAVVLLFAAVGVAFVYNPNLYYQYLYWGDRVHVTLTIEGANRDLPINQCIQMSYLYTGDDSKKYWDAKNFYYYLPFPNNSSSSLDWVKMDASFSEDDDTLLFSLPGGQKGYYVLKIEVMPNLFYHLFPGITMPEQEEWNNRIYTYSVYNLEGWDVWDLDLVFHMNYDSQAIHRQMSSKSECRTHPELGEDWSYWLG